LKHPYISEVKPAIIVEKNNLTPIKEIDDELDTAKSQIKPSHKLE